MRDIKKTISELKFNPESLMRFRKKAKTPGGKTVVGWLTRHELDFILNDAEQERIRKGDFYIYNVEEYEGKYYRILPETVEDVDDEHEQNDLNILHREINFAIHILEQARQKIEYMKNFRPGIESLKQEEKMTKDPLETIVPPFRMCKIAFDLDPEAFSGSVFAWSLPCNKRKKEPFVDRREDIEFCRRDLLNAPPVYPAPTLKEILAKLCNFDLRKFGRHSDCSINSKIDPEKFSPTVEHADPTAAAMLLWLLIRGETAENDRAGKGEEK